MSYLYPIRPIGAGTCDIESLSSYLIRTSGTHCTTVGTLLAFLDEPRSEYDAWLNTATRTPVCSFIRPNQTTKELALRLSVATGLDEWLFRSMTFMSIADVLHRSNGFFSSHLRWCPACFHEWIQKEEEPYIKLIWLLDDVKGCRVHRCALQDRCDECGAFQERSHLGRCLYRCISCDSMLDKLGSNAVGGPSWKPSAPELEHFVQFIAENPEVIFPSNGCHRVMVCRYEESIALGRWEEFARSISPDFYPQLIYNSEHVLTLQSVFALARCLNTPMEQLLLGVTSSTNASLPLGDVTCPPRKRRKRRPRPGGRAQMIAEVNRYLESMPEEEAPSLKSVAEALDVSVGALRYLVPDMSGGIVEKRRQHVLSTKEASRRLLAEKIRAMTIDPSLRHAVSGKKALLRELLNENRWSKNDIRRALNVAFNSKLAAAGDKLPEESEA